MRNLVLSLLLIVTLSATGQRRTNLKNEIIEYKQLQMQAASYDVEFKVVFDNLRSVLEKDYVLTQVSSNGLFQGRYSERLKMNQNKIFETNYFVNAAISDARPYTVTIELWKERRSVNTSTGEKSEWKKLDQNSSKLDAKLYEKIMGPITLPQSLQARVDEFNAQQPSDVLRLLPGKDY